VASAVAFTSGAAVFHKIQDIFVAAAASGGPASNESLYSEPDNHHGEHPADRLEQAE
jgi:hypothetical protein